jgi:inner membrane protein
MIYAGMVAAAPDIDTLFFGIIPYAHFFGHRGFFHSPFFAILFAVTVSCLLWAVSEKYEFRASLGLAAVFALAMASHGILDAMTNAGLGVMLFYPFSEGRIFFPWRPFHAPPINISNLSIGQLQMMFHSELPIILSCAAVAGLTKIAQIRTESKKEVL